MVSPPATTTASSFSIDSSPPEGFALLCTLEGDIRSVILASLEGSAIGETLCDSVDPATKDACRVFLNAIRRGGLTRSTPLRIGLRDLHSFGTCGDDELRIVAVIDPSSAAPFAEHAADRAGHEGFRDLAREIRRTHSTYELYEELARVNNNLVTAQRELARSVAELQRINSWKDELLGMAAHDLRNPLHVNSAIISFLLDDEFPPPEGAETRTLLERLRANSDYMTRLVDSVLDFAAIESGRVRLDRHEVPVDEVIREVVEMLRIIALARNVEIRYEADSHTTLDIDPVKVGEAIQNIVSNAVQYSPSGSRVDVRVRDSDSAVKIEVEDRGPGIAEKDIPELFKPFQRLVQAEGKRQKSVGLGLAITRRLIEAHSGRIDVRSQPGAGTTFIVSLPRTQVASGTPPDRF